MIYINTFVWFETSVYMLIYMIVDYYLPQKEKLRARHIESFHFGIFHIKNNNQVPYFSSYMHSILCFNILAYCYSLVFFLF